MAGNYSLPQALQLEDKPELVAFVGAGGKSSLMIALARQLSGRILITTTTQMFAGQITSAAVSLRGRIWTYPNLPKKEDFTADSKLFLVAASTNRAKVGGVPLNLPRRLLKELDLLAILVEADGARMLPVKAPAAHEPAIPTGASLVVPVMGIDCLDQPIQQVAHRPELLARLLGKLPSELITIPDLAKLVRSPEGGLKNVPAGARIIPAINKVESQEKLQAARKIAQLALSEPRIEQVVLSQAISDSPIQEVHKRVTAVILAAGESKRMGPSKQLLPWGDTSVLGQTIRNVGGSAVYDLLVVLGHEAAAVGAVAQAEGVPTVTNEMYAVGEMLSSLQVAVSRLDPQIAAVLVVLADQPMVEAQSINQLLQAYWKGLGAIIAPEYQGQRGNPVLIDRRHFAELMALPVGSAPRDLLRRHKVQIVAVDAPSVIQDIDRLQDYEKYKPS